MDIELVTPLVTAGVGILLGLLLAAFRAEVNWKGELQRLRFDLARRIIREVALLRAEYRRIELFEITGTRGDPTAVLVLMAKMDAKKTELGALVAEARMCFPDELALPLQRLATTVSLTGSATLDGVDPEWDGKSLKEYNKRLQDAQEEINEKLLRYFERLLNGK